MGTQHILCRKCHMPAILAEKEVVDCLYNKRPVTECMKCSHNGKTIFGVIETLKEDEISVPTSFERNGHGED